MLLPYLAQMFLCIAVCVCVIYRAWRWLNLHKGCFRCVSGGQLVLRYTPCPVLLKHQFKYRISGEEMEREKWFPQLPWQPSVLAHKNFPVNGLESTLSWKPVWSSMERRELKALWSMCVCVCVEATLVVSLIQFWCWYLQWSVQTQGGACKPWRHGGCAGLVWDRGVHDDDEGGLRGCRERSADLDDI